MSASGVAGLSEMAVSGALVCVEFFRIEQMRNRAIEPKGARTLLECQSEFNAPDRDCVRERRRGEFKDRPLTPAAVFLPL
jgi:hypothetical protein